MVQAPAPGGGQVPRLGLQPFQPLGMAAAAKWPVGLLGQGPVIIGVPGTDLGGIGTGRQPIDHEPADGLQHLAAGPVTGGVELDEAVPGQRLRQLQRPALLQLGHLCSGADGPAADEHRRRLQQRPLRLIEQAHAPLHRGPECALPRRQVYRAGTECVQRYGQPA